MNIRLTTSVKWFFAAVAGTGVALCSLQAGAAGIRDSKHNLSASGPGPIKALDEEELCIFCHTPHQARRDIPFLWNRADSTATYTPYKSSTLYAAVGQPTGASKLCLSCHDGTVALGMLGTRTEEVEFVGELRFMPKGPSRIGTDLSTSHPVSLVYDAALTARNKTLNDPATLVHPVHLDKNKQLQCTACHEPHDNSFGKFLVMSNKHSTLCTVCHNVPGWIKSDHALSVATWKGLGIDPWPDSQYATVAENGCANCHTSHGAGGAQRLLKHAAEEDNCLGCHNKNVAATDIGPELTKPFRHAVQSYFGVHDPAEDFTKPVAKHVECADCHNPHYTNSGPGAAQGGPPVVSGATAGVSGIDIDGSSVSPAVFGYEICFKCHGDTQMLGSSPITRQLDQLNTRLEFDPANPSFHPVAALGVNQNVPSLLTPWTEEKSRIDCVDCHNNSAALGPRGPHGSDYRFLLAREYATADLTTESAGSYALCYQCHSRTSLLGDNSFKHHNLHIVQQKTPCSACHDPHGVSVTQGNAINNSHLINFDLNIVQPDSITKSLFFEDHGTFSGMCFLNCHGVPHQPKAYE